MLKKLTYCLFAVSMIVQLSRTNARAAVIFSEDFETYSDAQLLTAGANPNGWTQAAAVSFDRVSDPPTNLVAGADINGVGRSFQVPDSAFYPYDLGVGEAPWQAGQIVLSGGAIWGGTAKLSFEIHPFSSGVLGIVLRDPVSGDQVEAINSNNGMHLSVNADAKEFIGDYGANDPGDPGNDNEFFTEVNFDLSNSTVSLTVRSSDPVGDPTGFTPDPTTTATYALPAGFSPSQILLVGQAIGASGPSRLDNITLDHVPIPEPSGIILTVIGFAVCIGRWVWRKQPRV